MNIAQFSKECDTILRDYQIDFASADIKSDRSIVIEGNIVAGGDYRTFPATEKEVEYYYKKGLNVMNLGYMDEWGMLKDLDKRELFLRNVENKLRRWDLFIKEHKWKDFTWIYHCFDESSSRSAEVQEIVGQFMNIAIPRLKREFPWLQFETANPYMEKYADLFDIWTSTSGYIDYKWSTYKKLIATKKTEIWDYTTNGSVHESNFMLDYPGIYPRIMLWQLFQHKITGMLYFEVDCFSHQKNAYKNAPKWPENEWNPEAFHANSDGILLYPGPGGEPLASIRLANLRDGVDDYEALSVLDDLAVRLKNMKSVEAL